MSEIFQNLVRNFFPKNFFIVKILSEIFSPKISVAFLLFQNMTTKPPIKRICQYMKKEPYAHTHIRTSRYFATIRPQIWNFYFPVYKKAEEGFRNFRRLKTPLATPFVDPLNKEISISKLSQVFPKGIPELSHCQVFPFCF